ncbi:hypothetical protein MSEO_20960 [Mycobacterium seoulense]|uniref:Uncharacterized protein n=1 Tax=Mycobacterium seoulense TaxID=386911 RepID=A0A7I7NY55_9MYCO|nr:hypothetical protein MSEO_20960 [Mycobacterium seoulense]
MPQNDVHRVAGREETDMTISAMSAVRGWAFGAVGLALAMLAAIAISAPAIGRADPNCAAGFVWSVDQNQCVPGVPAVNGPGGPGGPGEPGGAGVPSGSGGPGDPGAPGNLGPRSGP